MYRWFQTVFPVLFFIIAAAGIAVAEEVALDKEFGNEGLVITKLGSRVDQATSIAVQEDGKIVVAGSSDNGLGSKMAVIRYFPDGVVDHEFSFSSGGSLGTVHADDAVHAVAFGDNGLILLGGTLNVDGYRQSAVARLLPNGQLDLTFGVNGIAYVEVGDVDSEIRDLVVDEQGRIIVTGFIDDGSKESPLIARLNEDGELDSFFNEDGIVIDSSSTGRGAGLAESADGKLIVGGYSVQDTDWKGLYLARFLQNGDLDNEFGDGGRSVWFDDIEQIIVHDIAVAPDEKIILAGEVELSDGQHRIMLARYEKDGLPDLGFGENGILVHDTGLDSSVYSLVVHPDTTIIAAGYQVSSTGKDMVIIRYLPVMDIPDVIEKEELEKITGVSGDEAVEIIKIAALSIEEGAMNIPVAASAPQQYEADLITTELAGSDEVSNDILMTEDGTIYTVGSSGDEDDSAFMVARYSGVVGDGYPVGSTGSTITEFYRIGTMPVTGVTRVGATTGGNIVFSGGADDSTCLEGCDESCKDRVEEEDNATCISECEANCLVPTVTQRGVVYSVEPNPVYDDGGEDDSTVGGDEDVTSDVNGDATDEDTSTGLNRFFNLDDYYVREGQTNDGSGAGIYTSEIEEVNPQTVYYVRAYAVLSDGSVIYGNEYKFKSNDSCFIATAAFGSIDMFAVTALRDFRDQYLIPHEWGKSIVNTYYFVSPAIADLVEQSFVLRILIILLLIPAVAGALFLLYTTVLMKCIVIAASVIWYLNTFMKKEYGIVHE